MNIYDQKFGEQVILTVLAVLAEESPPTSFGGIRTALEARGQGMSKLMLLSALSAAKEFRQINVRRRFLLPPVITITPLGVSTHELFGRAA